MKNRIVRIAALSALGLAAGPAPAIAAPAAARPVAASVTRNVSITSVTNTAIVRAVSGRVVEGKVTFASTLGGSPTGTATEACARTKVSASKYVAPVPGSFFDPGAMENVKTVSATPVNAADLSKGCKYTLAGLPANVNLSIDANYFPPSAWNPICQGDLTVIYASKGASVTLPSTNFKLLLDFVIDVKQCEFIR